MRIIAGKFKNKQMIVPKVGTRPTLGAMREAVFNMCQHEIEGATMLDLFAGSGAMGFEALSRGAAHVTYVENNRIAIRLIKENIASFGVEKQTTVFPIAAQKAIEVLGSKGKKFDLIYIDPPYGKGLGEEVLGLLETTPLLNEGGTILVEEGCSIQGRWNRFKWVDERRVGRSILTRFTHSS